MNLFADLKPKSSPKFKKSSGSREYADFTAENLEEYSNAIKPGRNV